jgi:hypothetical protein
MSSEAVTTSPPSSDSKKNEKKRNVDDDTNNQQQQQQQPLKQQKLDSIQIKKVVFDIEGTTTSISFVHDILFPYVRSNLNEFIEKHWSDLKENVSDFFFLRF